MRIDKDNGKLQRKNSWRKNMRENCAAVSEITIDNQFTSGKASEKH